MVARKMLAIITACLIASLSAVPYSAAYAFWHGAPGAPPPTCVFPQPADAIAAGFNVPTLCENWSTLNDMDLNNTRVDGFNWYLNGFFPVPNGWYVSEFNSFTPTLPQYIVLNNNNTITVNQVPSPPANHFGNYVQTCAWDGSKIVGRSYGGGFFLDFVASFNSSIGTSNMPGQGGNPNASGGNWPANWMEPIEFLGGAFPSGHFVDITNFEMFPVGSGGTAFCGGKCQPIYAIHDIYNPPNFAINQVVNDWGPTITAAFPSFDTTQMHHYSMLWIPMALNSGNGSITWKVDGVTVGTQSYSAAGSPSPPLTPSNFAGQLSEADTSHFCIFFDPGLVVSNPITVGAVQIWQPGLVILAPTTATIANASPTPVTGVGAFDSFPATSITATVTDNNGLLSATGTGISGAGTTSMSISSTPANVTAALATLTDTGTLSDTITLNSTDNFGHTSATKTIAVTVGTPGLATFDPAHTDTANVTLSAGNLTAAGSGTGSNWGSSRATNGHSTGKYYHECFYGGSGNATALMGLLNNIQSVNAQFVGETTNSIGNQATTGSVYYNNTIISTSATITPGSTSDLATDVGAGLGWWRSNGGNWNNSPTANPATGVGGIALGLSGTVYPGVSTFGNTPNNSWHCNFGATSYTYAAPSGFGTW